MRFSQVPHHTANSWSSYWTRDPLSDRLLAAARERVTGGRGSTRDDGKEEIEVEDGQETVEEESSVGSDKDDAAMSEHGHFFGAAEVRAMAKYIAGYNPDDWAMMTGKQRWLPYHLEVTPPPVDHLMPFANLKLSVQHPHRSEASYCMKYRGKEQGMFSVRYFHFKVETFSEEFLKLAERYRIRALRQQRGTPSWANTSGRKPLVG